MDGKARAIPPRKKINMINYFEDKEIEKITILAIKTYCEHTIICIYCPFKEFCINNALKLPFEWEESSIPKLV